MSASVKFRDVFTMAKLNDAWERAARDELGFNVDSMNLTNFRKFMVDEFQCPQGACYAGGACADRGAARSEGHAVHRAALRRGVFVLEEKHELLLHANLWEIVIFTVRKTVES